ncbi:MAG: PRC-barrel domain-containing protein [Elainellaceae cyanobacterium]
MGETDRTNSSELVKHSEVINQLVIDSATMEELGRVETLWMYPQRNRVLGFVCKPGMWGSKRLVFKLPQLVAFGDNSVLTEGEPEPTVAGKVQQLQSLIHCEVWSDAGNRVGKITDCLFNLKSGTIIRYLLVTGQWAGITEGIYLLSPKQIKSFGRSRVLIADAAVADLKLYQPGIRQRLAEVSETLREDYIGTVTDEWRSLTQRAQFLTQQARERMASLTDQAKQTLEQWNDQLSEEARSVVSQARDTGATVAQQTQAVGETLADRIREEGQTFADHLSEQTQPLGDRAEEQQTVSVQADEILDDDWEWEADWDSSEPKASVSTHSGTATDADWDDADLDEWDEWDDASVPASQSEQVISQPDAPTLSWDDDQDDANPATAAPSVPNDWPEEVDEQSGEVSEPRSDQELAQQETANPDSVSPAEPASSPSTPDPSEPDELDDDPWI